jgi:outer membrane protein assembly factor BamE (lipoprotein component of BamABCDE complex)
MALTGLVLALLAACSKVTADNYAKVKASMTREQVYDMLGKPDEVSGGDVGPISMSTETWKGSKQTVKITFGGDKVVLKSISPNDETEQ